MTKWIILGLCALPIIPLSMGKCSFLIAGYNLMSKEEKAKYYEKRLCRLCASGLFVMLLFASVQIYLGDNWPSTMDFIIPTVYLGTAVVMFILGITVCKRK